jgi:hypothetical protein
MNTKNSPQSFRHEKNEKSTFLHLGNRTNSVYYYSFLIFLAATLLIPQISSATGCSDYEESTGTIPTTAVIDARARYGYSAYEGILFTPGSPSGLQLNPSGNPKWVAWTFYDVKFTYTASTGQSKWEIDFNGDSDFNDSQERVTSNSPTLAGTGFNAIWLNIQGASSNGAMMYVKNFTINGTNFGTYSSNSNTVVEPLFEYQAGNHNITITAEIKFTAGFSNDQPHFYLRLGNQVSTKPVLTATQVNPSCFGSTNGSINLTPTEGSFTCSKTGYTYLWSPGGATTQDRSGLAAGAYTVVVTDGYGYTSSLTVTLSQPTLLVASSSATPIVCNGGTSTVTVTGSGGTPPYSGTGTFTVSAGTHNYTVTDSEGCSKKTSVTVTQPTLLVATSTATSISCYGGNATVT